MTDAVGIIANDLCITAELLRAATSRSPQGASPRHARMWAALQKPLQYVATITCALRYLLGVILASACCMLPPTNVPQHLTDTVNKL